MPESNFSEAESSPVKKMSLSLHFGIVAADKEFDSREIKVYIIDFLPYYKGDIEATEIKSQVGTNDTRSQEGSGTATVSNTITAQYFDLFSNRVYPPDVRKGEQVLIFSIGDTDTYYWVSLGRNDNLRRNEKLRFAVSDDVAYTKELDNDNTYYVEFNTLDGKKEIVISTAKSDSEEYRYLIKIDAKASTLQVNDDTDNMFLINSKEKQVIMRNADGCFTDLNKKNVTVCGVEDLILRAGRQIVKDAPLEQNSKTKGDNVNENIVDDYSLIAKKSIIFTAPMIGFIGPDGKCTNVTCKGDIITRGIYSRLSGPSNIGCDGDAATPASSTPESSSSEPTIIEANRPTTLKSSFNDGTTATTLREDAHYNTSNVSTTEHKSYSPPSIDIRDGSTKNMNANTPNQVDAESGRSCASWDQLTAAFDRVSNATLEMKNAVNKLAEKAMNGPLSSGDVDEIKGITDKADALAIEARVLGYNSYMPKNKGE